MKLREEILKEHSKAQCSRIFHWVGHSQKRFDELFHLFMQDEYRVTQRAGWPVSYAVQAHPELIKPHLDTLLATLKKSGLHNAVKRNGIRLLQYVNIPADKHGEVMNTCFGFLSSPTEAVAVKAFSISVLDKLANIYPEIIPEIKILLQDQLPHQTAAFKSRAKRFLENHL